MALSQKLIDTFYLWVLSKQLSNMFFNLFFSSFSCNAMPYSGCLALHEVNLIFKKISCINWLLSIPAGNYMFKVINRNTRTRCEVYSKLTIRAPEDRRSGVFIVNF